MADGYLRPLDMSLGVELPAWVQIPGIVAVVAGAALVLICGVMLSTRGIGTLRGEEWFMPREFVATGPFRFVRNPMSLGGAVLMTGIALWHRSALGLGLAAALFLVFHLVSWCTRRSRAGEAVRGQLGVPAECPSVAAAHHAVAGFEPTRFLVQAGHTINGRTGSHATTA